MADREIKRFNKRRAENTMAVEVYITGETGKMLNTEIKVTVV